MKIALLSNLKVNAPNVSQAQGDEFDELDVMSTMKEMLAVFQRLGHQAEFFEASIWKPYRFIEKLEKYKPDLCFNVAEGHYGDSRESHVPAILEMMRLPYTGSKVMTLAIGLNKAMTKQVLKSCSIPTAPFQLFTSEDDAIVPEFLGKNGKLVYPLFVKPNAEGTSMGIENNSIVTTVEELKIRVSSHLKKYKQSILVEKFIKGREVMVGIIGNNPNLTILPVLELEHATYGSAHKGIYTNTMKHNDDLNDYHYHCPALLTPKQTKEVQNLAKRVFDVLGCLDFSRVDIRLDEEDGYKPYVLEINPLAGLTPGFSDLCLEAKGAGWDYDRLIGEILTAAMTRYNLS